MNIKYITMHCPDCGEQMKNGILCINSSTNEFDVVELEQSQFNCIKCKKVYYIGDIDYFTE